MANKISDWNICDWLCVKVLGPGAARNGTAGAGRLLAWSHLPPEQSTLWLRRAGHVAFVYLIAPSKACPGGGDALFSAGFVSDCIAAAAAAAREPDRFAQTGAGWVLRECVLAQRAQTLQALAGLLPVISKEGLKSALEKCKDAAVKNRLFHAWEAAQGGAERKQEHAASTKEGIPPTDASSSSSTDASAKPAAKNLKAVVAKEEGAAAARRGRKRKAPENDAVVHSETKGVRRSRRA